MTIPISSSTEIVYRTAINALAGTETSFRFDRTMATTGTSSYTVPTNFLITVLNVVITNIDTTARTLNLKWTDGTLTINLLRNESLPSEATFISKKMGVSGTIHCLCSGNFNGCAMVPRS